MDWTAAANEVLKWGVIGTPLVYFGYKAIKGFREDWPEAKKRYADRGGMKARKQSTHHVAL